MSLNNNTAIAKILNPIDQDTIKNYPSRISIKIFKEDNKDIHLRLFPPKSLGFPKNIQVFKINRENLEQIQKNKRFIETLDNSENFKIEFNDNKTLIRFNEPMLYVRVILSKDSGENIKCFYKSMEIASTIIEDKPEIIFEMANITDVLIPLSLEYIDNIEYIKESTVINILEKKSNSFFSSCSISINKISYIMEKLKYMNIYNPFEKIKVPSQHNQKEATILLLQYLNFLALKPQFAKDLGLYGIDNSPDEENNLYVIKGTYHIRVKYYYGFIYSNNIEKIPSIEGKCTLKQIDGIIYKSRTPLGQISLNFNLSKEAVFYDIQRFNKAGKVDSARFQNHLISKNATDCFRERNLRLYDNVYYTVTPIDIFGRRGKSITSNTIYLENTSLPLPPKNIKAKIIQNAFPWLEVEEYREEEINKGIVHISFEYGEQQHLIAPNTEKITLLYKRGARTENDLNDIGTWNIIESIKIKPPIKGKVIFKDTLEMIVFPYDIKEVREKVYKNKDNEEMFYTELLINESHLEPDLFQNFTFRYKSNVFTVIKSHAGLAYDLDNTINKDYTTRFIIEGKNHNIEPNETIKLISSKSSELLVLITFKHPLGNLEEVSGGEIALNMQYYNKQEEVLNESFIGKVISNIKKVSNEKISVIARFKEKKFISILKDERVSNEMQMAARYYAPYLLSNQSLTINDTSSTSNISINIDASNPFETLWFSAISHQKENNSSLAVPFETKVMNPPEILADIPVPKLCNKKIYAPPADNDKKYAPPANADGYSNPRICWESNLNSVSYELSRALDKTIIATDKKNWLQGISRIESQKSISGTVKNFEKNEESGTFTINVEGDKEFYSKLKIMELGRIKIQNKYHKTLKVFKENDVINILCKPFIEITKVEKIINGTEWIAEQIPNYEELEKEEVEKEDEEKKDEELRKLANKKINQNAFGLVTGTPVPQNENSFTDTIPAKGSNRFFYKLRVVFASGHKSAWSECSEGVYQFPAIPKQIENFTVVKYKGQHMINWEKPSNPNIDGYLFYKREVDETLTELKDVKSDELIFKPKFFPENLLIFSKSILIDFSSESLENEEEIESYLFSNISVVGLKENTNLEIDLYGNLLYEVKESKYEVKGLKNCTENLSNLQIVKVSVSDSKKSFEEVVGRDENVYIVYLEEEELNKDNLVVVPYVEVDSLKLWERG